MEREALMIPQLRLPALVGVWRCAGPRAPSQALDGFRPCLGCENTGPCARRYLCPVWGCGGHARG